MEGEEGGAPRAPANPWAAAAPRGDVPAPAVPAFLTYVDGASVGFDMRLPLPAVCLKCGATDGLEGVPLKVRIRKDLIARAAFAAQGSARYGAVLQPGDKVDLRLPVCKSCLARKRDAQRYLLAAALAPVVTIILAIVTKLTVLVLVGLAAGAVLGFLGYSRQVSSEVRFERVDGDGVIRLGGVHPDASQAIVEAAAAAT